jgi:RNA polymerase sigma-70 factor, ECF subfamily
MLGTTTAAVKSALQRARARLDEVAPAPDRIIELDDPAARALLDRYIAAFEESDADALQRLLRADATLELPPSPVWFAGKDAATHAVAGLGCRGDWRMVATRANGQPAAAAYRRGADGAYRAYGIVVLTPATATSTATAAIAAITVFAEPGLLTNFGLPPIYPTSNRPCTVGTSPRSADTTNQSHPTSPPAF